YQTSAAGGTRPRHPARRRGRPQVTGRRERTPLVSASARRALRAANREPRTESREPRTANRERRGPNREPPTTRHEQGAGCDRRGAGRGPTAQVRGGSSSRFVGVPAAKASTLSKASPKYWS
ncbi:MAG: hypothetical protein ACK559_04370, partial [bacterium]